MQLSFKNFIIQTSRLQAAGDRYAVSAANTETGNCAVTCFVTQQDNALFFSQLRHYFKFYLSLPVEIIDVKKMGVESVKLFTQTTFLGMRKVYFIFAVDELNSEEKSALLLFFSQYQGPNQLYFVTGTELDQSGYKNGIVIEVPKVVDMPLFYDLITWHTIERTPRIDQFTINLFKNRTAISVDTACLLINYMRVLGANTKDFFVLWLDAIVPPDQSLFVLSQYFFKKNKKAFFEQWHAIKDLYEGPFWVTFWSEQVWRASMFIVLNKSQQRAQARVISFRLPFSFINFDWKNYEADELIAAHDFLYGIDHRIKNGCADYAFDLFFSQFFLDGFVRK